MKFLICNKCGNIVEVVKEKSSAITCCGDQMTVLDPGTSDGAFEKHLPVITQEGSKVTINVGSVDHPMMEAHYIEWIVIETKKGAQKANLKPGDAPKAEFILADDDQLISAYAYCNLHSLWKAEA